MKTSPSAVVGTILRESLRMRFHTDLREVFRAFDGREREFDWLITELECSRYPKELQLEHEWRPRTLTGDELSDIVLRQERFGVAFGEEPYDVQTIWAVLSGVPRGTPIHFDEGAAPYADGNPDFWKPEPTIQLPGGVVELVAFDSSLTLLIATDADLTRRFREHFPEALDLATYNASR